MGEALKHPEGTDATVADVIELFSHTLRAPHVPRATPQELSEYRRLLPRLRQMLDEWEAVKGSGGCPIARRLTAPQD